MSRSRRKTPIIGMTGAPTDKPFKTAEHRRERRAVKSTVKQLGEAPDPKLFGDPWRADKDGKRWLDPSDGDELMRK